MRLFLASLLFVTACAGTASYSASVSTPDLVVVEPGVQVIADYDEPIFYSENYYWRNDGGRWYRSSYHNRGWVVYEAPQRVRSINQPNRYRRYRPAGYQPKSSRPAPYRPASSQPAPYRPASSQPAPYRPAPSDSRPNHDNRDHDKRPDYDKDKRDKDDRKDDKRDRKDDRKDDKRDRKDDRKDDKRDRKD